jgi:hypothetical protein
VLVHADRGGGRDELLGEFTRAGSAAYTSAIGRGSARFVCVVVTASSSIMRLSARTRQALYRATGMRATKHRG